MLAAARVASSRLSSAPITDAEPNPSLLPTRPTKPEAEADTTTLVEPDGGHHAGTHFEPDHTAIRWPSTEPEPEPDTPSPCMLL